MQYDGMCINYTPQPGWDALYYTVSDCSGRQRDGRILPTTQEETQECVYSPALRHLTKWSNLSICHRFLIHQGLGQAPPTCGWLTFLHAHAILYSTFPLSVINLQFTLWTCSWYPSNVTTKKYKRCIAFND